MRSIPYVLLGVLLAFSASALAKEPKQLRLNLYGPKDRELCDVLAEEAVEVLVAMGAARADVQVRSSRGFAFCSVKASAPAPASR